MKFLQGQIFKICKKVSQAFENYFTQGLYFRSIPKSYMKMRTERYGLSLINSFFYRKVRV